MPPTTDQTQTTDQNAPDGSPNYGKPRKRKSNLYQFSKKTNLRALPPLVTYRRKIERRQQGEREEVTAAKSGLAVPDQTTPAPTVAAIPRPIRQRLPIEETDPFAPIGVRTGDLILKPFVETSAGYETNPNQVATGVKPSPALRLDAGLGVASDFSSSSLIANLRGGYSEFPANSNANRPDVNAVVDGRIDVTRRDQIETEARFSLATQTPGSFLLANPSAVYIVDRPLIISEGATIGGTHDFGRLSVNLRGTFDRTEYGDATQSNGSLYRYSEDNYNDYGVLTRANYEITPAIIPFVEAGVDTRVRDNSIDLSGYARDSVGGTGRGGITFDFIGHFTGEASAGYVERHYNDPRLPNLKGPVIDANLIYAATPLTTLKLGASTFASETTLPGASGAISRTFTAEIDHQLFRQLIISGIATYQPNDYQGVTGHEAYTTLTLKGAYSFTRDVQLILSASHQTLRSTFIGDAFNDEVFLAGIRLQR